MILYDVKRGKKSYYIDEKREHVFDCNGSCCKEYEKYMYILVG